MSEQVPVRRENQPSLTPWRDPIAELWRSPWRDIDGIFDRIWRSFGTPAAFRPDGFVPAVDVEETDDAYVFEVELPGVKKEDVSIEVGDQELHITGRINEKQRTGTMRQQTRRTGTFDYRTTLPTGIDPDRAEARFDDGVLTVRIPKTEAGQRRKLKIS